MSKSTIALFAFFASLAWGEAAAPPAESAADRGAALCKSLTFQEKALGTFEFGMYIAGQKNIGAMKIDITAGDKATGAAYQTRFAGTMAMGPNEMNVDITAELAPHGGIISLREVESETSEEGESESVEVTHRVDGKWTHMISEGEEETTTTTEFTCENHNDMSSALLLAQVIDRSKPGTYEFRGVDFDGEEGAIEESVTLTVGGEEDFDFRGKPVKVKRLTFNAGDDVHALLCHDTEGVLAILPDPEAPIALIRGDAESVHADIGATAAAPAATASGGAATPTAAVVTYLNVVAKAAEVDALDKVMDWEAIYTEMSAENEDVKTTMDPSMLATMMKRQFAAAEAQVTTEQVEMLQVMLAENIEGDTATVDMPGAEGDPFQLRKAGENWLITHFPH